MLKNLKVRSKLLFSFGVAIVLILACIVMSLFGMNNVTGQFTDFYKSSYPTVKHAIEAQSMSRKVLVDISLASSGASDLETSLNNIHNGSEAINALFAQLEECYDSESQLYKDMVDSRTKAAAARAKVVERLENNDLQGATDVMNAEYLSAISDLINNKLQAIIDDGQAKADAAYASGLATSRSSFLTLFVIGAASVVLLIILAIIITRGFTRPIAEIEEAVLGMAKGNMHTEVTYQSKDELGVLAENLRFVLRTLSEYIAHICARMNSLAEGDFTVEMDMDYLGEFEAIKHAGNKIVESLNDALGQINTAADQVSSSSDQVSSGAQALSQGAVEQASSIETLVSNLNALSEQVSATAEKSNDINNLIATTADEVNNSNTKMEAMMNAMVKINDSSSEIEKIIKTIEDIAFQTNILALNAAVEAARAGESGKGFAVVADEVRTLASRSAEAAQHTTALISDSLNAVSEGNQIAEDTQKSLQAVVESSKQIEIRMEEITKATGVQSEQLQEVTVGIDQISSVIQTNSATAEESAAASEELFSQSSMLNSLVQQFQLRES